MMFKVGDKVRIISELLGREHLPTHILSINPALEFPIRVEDPLEFDPLPVQEHELELL